MAELIKGKLSADNIEALTQKLHQHSNKRVQKSAFLLSHVVDQTRDGIVTALPHVAMFLACLLASFPIATFVKPPSIEYMRAVLEWSIEEWERQIKCGYFLQISRFVHNMLVEVKGRQYLDAEFVVNLNELWSEIITVIEPFFSEPSSADSESVVRPLFSDDGVHDYVLDWLHTGVCFPGYPQIRKLGVRLLIESSRFASKTNLSFIVRCMLCRCMRLIVKVNRLRARNAPPKARATRGFFSCAFA